MFLVFVFNNTSWNDNKNVSSGIIIAYMCMCVCM